MVGGGTPPPLFLCAEECWLEGAFVFEEPLFDVESAPEAAERAVLGDDAVAGHDDGDAVGAVGAPHCARDGVDAFGECVVADGLPEGDVLEFIPDALLEFGTREEEREVELATGSREISHELGLGFVEQVGGGLTRFAVVRPLEPGVEAALEVVFLRFESGAGGELEEAEGDGGGIMVGLEDAGEEGADRRFERAGEDAVLHALSVPRGGRRG